MTGGVSDPSAQAGAESGEVDHWVSCSRCDKWRRVEVEYMPDDTADDWFCETVPGLSCEAKEEANNNTWRADPREVQAAAER